MRRVKYKFGVLCRWLSMYQIVQVVRVILLTVRSLVYFVCYYTIFHVNYPPPLGLRCP